MDPQPPEPPAAPPVVAVVVVADTTGPEPSPWLDEALAGLSRQDYPNLSVLVVDAGSAVDPTPRVAAALPGAYVRRLEHDPGFPAAANEVLKGVEGAAYFAVLHGDVAADPEAVRLLVEEALRSNAGIVGPKLVQWDAPERLLSVGLAVDKTGAVAPVVERGELDQEQHDGVRDVFAVPSALVLVRSDLFAALGGFDPDIREHGEDVDLCWRAQLVGARVLVAPAARARHRETEGPRYGGSITTGRAAAARHRLRSTLKNYGPFHLVRVLPQAMLVTVLQVLLAVARGRFADARAIASAWPANAGRLRGLRRARRAAQKLRTVPDAEVRRLQMRGSAELRSEIRAQVGGREGARALAEAGRNLAGTLSGGPARAAAALLGVLTLAWVIGCRHLVGGDVPAVGQLAPFPSNPLTFVRAFGVAWRRTGLGVEAAAPPAFALLGAAGVLFLGHMSLLRTVLVIGAWPVGAIGAWRLTRDLGPARARIVAVIVYLSVPVPYNALARGRVAGLVAYAFAPWLLSRLMRLTGADPLAQADPRPPVAAVVALGLVLALSAAFAPALLVVVPLVALALVLGSLLVGGRAPWRAAVLGVAAAAVATALLLPWTAEVLRFGDRWSTLGGVRTVLDGSPGLGSVLRFETGPLGAPPLGWAFLVAAALPLIIGVGWRFAWAARLWVVALVCAGAAWATGRGWVPGGLQAPEVLLAPAAAALAAATALGMVAFDVDLRRYRFGWRQAASFGAAVAVLAGTLPVLGAARDGRWHMPSAGVSKALEWTRGERGAGAFRILWLGDAAAVPVDGWPLGAGLAYATSREGPPDAVDLWPGPETGADARIRAAIEVAGRGETTRLGHLLAPMAVRYVVIPQRLAPGRIAAPGTPVPAALERALAAQIDLRLVPSDPSVTVFENTAWGPGRAAVDRGVGLATAPRGVDLSANRPVLPPTRSPVRFRGSVPDGRVFLSDAASGWRLSVAGSRAPRSGAFGWAQSFRVGEGGSATLRFPLSFVRIGLLAAELVLWVLAAGLVLRSRRRAAP
jgi:GT2 family glycosyltransferase